MAGSEVGLRVSLGLALIALIMVAIAENARIPVDNPATHLELTMVHEAMVLEYSARHLALIELAASLKLLALHLAHRLRLRAVGHCARGRRARRLCDRLRPLSRQACNRRIPSLPYSKPPLPRCACSACRSFLGAALMLGLLAALLRFVSGGPLTCAARIRRRPPARRLARAGELHDALSGPGSTRC
jgi:hypothetical protein